MKKSFFILKCSLMLLLGMIQAGYVFGGAIDNSGVGTTALSMGGAFSGIADDVSAIYYNPAGLGFIENDTGNAQIYSVIILTEFNYSTDSYKDTSDEVVVNPGFFISKKYKKWALGYGFYIPYAGGGARFNNFQGTGYNIDGFEAYVAHTPTAAYQLSKSLSIGAGLSVYYGLLESKVFRYAEIESDYDGIAGYGANIGILYKPTNKLSAGFTVKSKVPIKMDGKVKVSNNIFNIPEGDSEIEFDIPYYFLFGLGYRPNPKVTIGLDLCYMMYGDMDKRTLTTAGVEFESPTYYKDSWRFGLGIRYEKTKEMSLMAGLKYTQGSTRDKGLNVSNDVDILIPPSCDVDLLSITAGISYYIYDKVKMNISGFYVFGMEVKESSKKFSQEHTSMLIGLDFLL